LETLGTIISVIGALLVICIIIMVHELGHFSIGRACKIKVTEFAIGFGPKIKKWVKNDITYSIRWVLLGGFTKFYGEDEASDDKDAFNNQPAGRRALAIAAGPVFNIVFAVIFAVIFLVAFGEYVPAVSEVWEGSAAEEAGLKEGDIITEMDGVDIDFYMEVTAAQRRSNDESIHLKVLRDGQEHQMTIPKRYYERIPEANRNGRTDEQMEVDGVKAGFTYWQEHKPYGFFESIAASFRWTFSALRETLFGILGIFGGIFGAGMPEGVMGIGGIVSELGMALRQSLEYLLKLCAVINISLAVFNLLPLPALDGGRLVFIGIEKLFRRPVPRKVEGMIHFVGFILLFGLMIFFLFRDVTGMVGG